MHEPDDQFENVVRGRLRSYARLADRPIDASAVASRAAAGGGRGARISGPGGALRGGFGFAGVAILVGLLVVALVAAVTLGGRQDLAELPSPSLPSLPVGPSPAASPSVPVAPSSAASPSPSQTTSASPSGSIETATPAASASTPSATPTAIPSATVAAEPLPADFQAMSVTFVSPDEGWVLGSVACGAKRCPAVGHTLDAGRSWTALDAPATTINVHPGDAQAETGIGAIRFADPRDGWAFGPELWATHDGGHTWVRSIVPGASDHSGVLTLETARGTTHAVLYDQQAGGFRVATSPVAQDGWRLVPPVLPVGAGPVPSVQLVLAADAGWILQNDRTVVNGARFVSGEWQSWQPMCADAAGPAYLAASSALDVVAVCDVGLWAKPQGGHLFVSRDGGASFSETGTRIAASLGGAVASPGTTTIVAAAAGSGGTGLEGSFDGGATWSAVLDLGQAQAVDLGFTTQTQGVVIATSSGGGAGRLFMTRDGGRTWQAVTF